MFQSPTFALAILIGLSGASTAFALDCHPKHKKDFTSNPTTRQVDMKNVHAEEISVAGSARCDVVYHVDGKNYFLGGCNIKRDGKANMGFHGRIPLICE